MEEVIRLGRWTKRRIDELLHGSFSIKETGKRIDFISSHFLGTPYRESTLIGDINTPEVFVIDLEGVDCFTFIEYVQAMRLSGSFLEFKDNLMRIRYRSGFVDFKNRNHFFTDWIEYNSDIVMDVTCEFRDNIEIEKILNEEEGGSRVIQGIMPVCRRIRYIPSRHINDSLIGRLESGDHIGIYSPRRGLDVSHVGIIIRKDGAVYLRHASSSERYRMVVDEELRDYISNKPGIIVLRPKDIDE